MTHRPRQAGRQARGRPPPQSPNDTKSPRDPANTPHVGRTNEVGGAAALSTGSTGSTAPTAAAGPAAPAVLAGPGAPSSLPPQIEVRRSPRRRRTVSAYREGDRTIVLIPARMSRAEEQRWIAVMIERLEAQERRRAARGAHSDTDLAERATSLSQRFLAGAAVPASVRWVTNQGSRWGSCTPADGTIRLSHRLREMPGWVIDYVLVHELAHLLEAGHGPKFQALVDRYPRAERARGYLMGVVAAPGARSGDDGYAPAGPACPGVGDADEPEDIDTLW